MLCSPSLILPEISHPPYGVYQPRVLNRWLDVNSQNGPLSRISTYIIVPATTIKNTVGYPYSILVAYYNYVATNRFSLTSELNLADQGITICVAYDDVTDDGYATTVRYSLFRSLGDRLYFEVPEYIGQIIEKSFRIELWNSMTYVGSNLVVPATTIYTSVKGTTDYRFALDYALATAGVQTTPGDILTFLANPVWQGIEDINGNVILDINGMPIEPIK